MQIKLEPRVAASKWMSYGSPVIAGTLTIVFGAILFAALGRDPLLGLYTFFIEPLTSVYELGELGLKATPLAIIAIGLAIGFRGNVWNIGAEGQLLMGAICGGGVALAFHGEGGWWVMPLMVLAAAGGGMAWGAIPALLRTRFNANEILVSLMLTYAAVQILGWLVHGPWTNPEGQNFPETRTFEDWAMLPELIDGTRLNVSAIFALLMVAAGWVFMKRSFVGFKVNVVGQALDAAKYAGYSQNRVVWISFLIGGGAAGLAGLIEVTGPIDQLNATFAPGYGFAAIIVAFLGRLHPVGILFAALLMSLTFLGGEALQISMKMPKAVTGVFQGMLLFFVLATDVLIRYRIKFVSRKPATAEEAT